jgi:CubicO group peptidase (beta-lactamase class C family)
MPFTAPPPLDADLDWDLTPALEVAADFVAAGSLPCLVFGVVDGAGHSEVVAISGPEQEAHDDSVFFIASVTKAIVATALMRYVDEGRLDLHAPLSRYVPEFRDDGREAVSAWHLLTHTSGLPDMPPERIQAERPTYRRVLAETLTTTPRWEPGTRYEYNSSAWCLLSEAMARLSSTAWPEVLTDRLLGPVGMVDTTFDARPSRSRIVPVTGIDISNRLVAEALLWFLARAALPGGGLFGTVPDLLRLGLALLTPRSPILSRAAVAQMAEQQVEGIPLIAGDGTTSYVEQGLGWRRSGGGWPAGDAVLTHGGRSGSRLWVDPERGFALAFLTNVWGVSSEAAIAVLEEVYRARP